MSNRWRSSILQLGFACKLAWITLMAMRKNVIDFITLSKITNKIELLLNNFFDRLNKKVCSVTKYLRLEIYFWKHRS